MTNQNPDGNEFVFVYQTLKDPRLRYKVLHHTKDAKPAVIVGYREVSLDTKEGSNFHTIIPFVKSSVLGDVFSVNGEELKELDKWEDQYSRTKVLARPNDEHGGPFHAWAYTLKPESVKWK